MGFVKTVEKIDFLGKINGKWGMGVVSWNSVSEVWGLGRGSLKYLERENI